MTGNIRLSYSEAHLQSARRKNINQDIAASIVGCIRQAASELRPTGVIDHVYLYILGMLWCWWR
jgi:hypothetical protein